VVAKTLHVVYLGHVARLSGAEISVLRLIEASPQNRSTVILAEDGPLVASLRAAGATVEVVPLAEHVRALKRGEVTSGPRTQLRAVAAVLRYAWTVSRRIRRLRPDVVHTISLKAGVYGAIAARLARAPVVWHLHDRLEDDYLPGPVVPLMRLLTRLLPNALLVPSAATLAAAGGPSRRRHAVIPNPVLAPHSGALPDPAPVFTVGMIGRLAAWKGQHLFLEAFAEAFPGGPERAVVAGSAMFGELDYEEQLRALTTRLGLDDRVTFTGFVDDVEGLIGTLAGVVHASVTADPLNTVIAETLACGVPLIATAEGGHTEHVHDGRDCLLYPPGDVGALSSALRRVAGDPDLRRTLARNALETARAFDPATAAARVDAFYREVIAGAPATGSAARPRTRRTSS
jgi:glycosyltransferase involved in cell wall biosynthesis